MAVARETAAAPTAAATARPTLRRRVLRWLVRLALLLVALAALYLLAAWILGAIARNSDWRPPTDGITVVVASNGVHTDFYLPAKNGVHDWTSLAPLEDPTSAAMRAPFVLLGWGDRGFFLEAETWDDVRAALVLRALFLPSRSAVHLYYRHWLPRSDDQHVRLHLRVDEYRRLCAFLSRSFRRDANGDPILIAGRSYAPDDVFYEGRGSYSLLYTCNNWAADALAAAGVRAPWWSPFDGPILDHLRRAGAR